MSSLNPVDLQTKVIKALAGLAIVGGILFAVYMQGRSDGKQTCLNAVQKQATALAERRADNAIDATQRFGDFMRNDRALEVGIDDALSHVRAYYENQPPETIEVQVPGKKEKVYVPISSCPSTFLNPDELQLYNLGNKRSDLDFGDSKGVSDPMPEGPAER